MWAFMGGTHGRRRDKVASGILLAGMVLAACPGAFALDPSLDVSQYVHTPWKIRDGFTEGTISAMAQTPVLNPMIVSARLSLHFSNTSAHTEVTTTTHRRYEELSASAGGK